MQFAGARSARRQACSSSQADHSANGEATMLGFPWLRTLKSRLHGTHASRMSIRRKTRPATRKLVLDRLEERNLLTASWLTGAGAVGDSYTVPYFNDFGPNTHNWVEALADLRGINFGGRVSESPGRGPGTGDGYANVWWGPNSYGGAQVAAPGLANQISAGQVSLAVDEVGPTTSSGPPFPTALPGSRSAP